jgi:hypothetical protein
MKADARKVGNWDHAKELKKCVHWGLKMDRQARSDKVAEDIKTLLLEDQVKKCMSCYWDGTRT